MEEQLGKYQFTSELNLDSANRTYISPFPTACNVDKLNSFYIYDENYTNICRIKIVGGWGEEAIQIELKSSYFERVNDVIDAVRSWTEWTFENTNITKIKTIPVPVMKKKPSFWQEVFETLGFRREEFMIESGAYYIKEKYNKEDAPHE
jgi:hypothetical protein